MVMASPSVGVNLPQLTAEYETSVSNLFIVGELGRLALIKNAINQGRDCADTIAARIPELRKENRAWTFWMLSLLALGLPASARRCGPNRR